MLATVPVHWLDQSEHPYPVPVLDVRPVTFEMISTSADPQMAMNAMSYGNDTGLAFAEESPPSDRLVPLALRYRVDAELRDGALFRPAAMEHKWALFLHSGRVLFVRSWQRRLLVTATIRVDNGHAEVVEAHGSFVDDDEDPRFTEACIDFIVRTHAVAVDHPAPLPFDPGTDLEAAGVWCFGAFGNLAALATHHRFTWPAPDQPLTNSP
jgi:hypothetical protein